MGRVVKYRSKITPHDSIALISFRLACCVCVLTASVVERVARVVHAAVKVVVVVSVVPPCRRHKARHRDREREFVWWATHIYIILHLRQRKLPPSNRHEWRLSINRAQWVNHVTG